MTFSGTTAHLFRRHRRPPPPTGPGCCCPEDGLPSTFDVARPMTTLSPGLRPPETTCGVVAVGDAGADLDRCEFVVRAEDVDGLRPFARGRRSAERAGDAAHSARAVAPARRALLGTHPAAGG